MFCPFGFWPIAPDIIAARSKFDFDSKPALANSRPSLLKVIDVTVRPIVPAEYEPIMFVTIAARASMLGITGTGIDPLDPLERVEGIEGIEG
ncbi:MAG TPA: hypothetical protein VF074_07595, partial [Pyrinomonadaceae bacterium]